MYRILLAVLLWTAASTADARNIDWLMRIHIDWITQHSDLEYNGEDLPTVYFVTDDELWYTVHGRPRTQGEIAGNFSVLGIYNIDTRSILLPENYTLDDGTTAHILVHELVHYLQDIGGVYEHECPSNNEKLAYDLHHDWMEQFQTGGEPTNPLFLLFVTMSCQDRMMMGEH